MEEQLISFETAKLAKEKGFNEECYSYFTNTKEIKRIINFTISNDEIDCFSSKGFNSICLAPTQSLLQKWLREVYHIDVLVFHKHRLKGTTWTSEVHFNDHLRYTNHDYENDYTYEEALEQALQEALKLI